MVDIFIVLKKKINLFIFNISFLAKVNILGYKLNFFLFVYALTNKLYVYNVLIICEL